MAASLRARAFLAVVVSAVALSMMACKADTDLGKPGCHLLKALPDGGATNVIVAELSAGKDFLSFGSVECEDLICVLDQDGVAAIPKASRRESQQANLGALNLTLDDADRNAIERLPKNQRCVSPAFAPAWD